MTEEKCNGNGCGCTCGGDAGGKCCRQEADTTAIAAVDLVEESVVVATSDEGSEISDASMDAAAEEEALLEKEAMALSGNEGGKFRDGQEITFIKVRFPGNPKNFPFYIGKRHFFYGERIVAMSDRGMAIGFISSFPYQVKFNKSMLPIKTLIKAATEKELQKEEQNEERARHAKGICNRHITELKLEMELTHVEYTQFGKKAVFYFTAPGRVDFRTLVKNLVAELKMRIELRQIYVRDRTAAIGGIGPCGRQLCCNSFLERYGHVNIRMAKNQNLTLSSNKLNGMCQQMKCCIQYEDEGYTYKKSRLPEIGAFIKTNNGDVGLVEKLYVLPEEFELLTDKGKRRRYSSSQYDPKLSENQNPQALKFEPRFEVITDETLTIIGKESVPQ
ncbi:MAG: hypothetical protein HQK50_06800 [Oligoflexia bacterium]|nr:hypothetical protein [Oligoflexia bacterium]MBF0365262.1 hypothetical protein [Oligoflexia bacterium]